ncbi:hypothetical protein [Roseomonas mucosa]
MRSFRILTSLLLFGGSPSLAAMTPWQDVHAAKPDRPAPEAAPLAVPDRLALAAVPWSASLPENLPALEQERAALQERLAQIGLTIDRILAGVVMTARKADPWGPARESDPAPLLEALGQERQLILDRLGQVDRKSLLLATTTSLPARAAPRDPDADLLAGTDPAPGQEDAETPEALMARVDRLGAAMDRLLASIEAPPESQERGGASGEELLKRLYALRDAQTRLLERDRPDRGAPHPAPTTKSTGGTAGLGTVGRRPGPGTGSCGRRSGRSGPSRGNAGPAAPLRRGGTRTSGGKTAGGEATRGNARAGTRRTTGPRCRAGRPAAAPVPGPGHRPFGPSRPAGSGQRPGVPRGKADTRPALPDTVAAGSAG